MSKHIAAPSPPAARAAPTAPHHHQAPGALLDPGLPGSLLSMSSSALSSRRLNEWSLRETRGGSLGLLVQFHLFPSGDLAQLPAQHFHALPQQRGCGSWRFLCDGSRFFVHCLHPFWHLGVCRFSRSSFGQDHPPPLPIRFLSCSPCAGRILCPAPLRLRPRWPTVDERRHARPRRQHRRPHPAQDLPHRLPRRRHPQGRRPKLAMKPQDAKRIACPERRHAVDRHTREKRPLRTRRAAASVRGRAASTTSARCAPSARHPAPSNIAAQARATSRPCRIA